MEEEGKKNRIENKEMTRNVAEGETEAPMQLHFTQENARKQNLHSIDVLFQSIFKRTNTL